MDTDTSQKNCPMPPVKSLDATEEVENYHMEIYISKVIAHTFSSNVKLIYQIQTFLSIEIFNARKIYDVYHDNIIHFKLL